MGPGQNDPCLASPGIFLGSLFLREQVALAVPDNGFASLSSVSSPCPLLLF